MSSHGYVIIGPTGRILVDGADYPSAESCREHVDMALEHALEISKKADYENDVAGIDFSTDLARAIVADHWLNKDQPPPPEFLEQIQFWEEVRKGQA